MKPVQPYRVMEFVRRNGNSPYREWLNKLDLTVRARIQARIFRLETGNLGDYRSVAKGVWESRLDFGPGYRIYFAFGGDRMILLLAGGDKRSQKQDIQTACAYWNEYLEVSHGKKK